MILVTILFVQLRYDSTRLGLLMALFQHPSMQRPIPTLKAGHAKPRGRPVLVLIMYGMAGGQMMVGVQTVEHCSSLMRPRFGAEAIKVIP